MVIVIYDACDVYYDIYEPLMNIMICMMHVTNIMECILCL
jgi:hypothetical protein